MQRASALGTLLIVVSVVLLLAASPVAAQQTYVSQFDVFAGYAFLNSPHIGLFENGFQAQFGYRPKPWYSLGFDFSRSTGDLVLTPDLLPPALSKPINDAIPQYIAAKLLPPGYVLAVSAHSTSLTFAVGPQLAYRHFSHLTLFIRPSLGAIHEEAVPHPGASDWFATHIAQELAPSGKKTDWTGFYGFGGGFDILFSKHVGIRTQADLVWDHLFNDVLADGRWTVRFSVGPCFNFGKNIVK
ncbi:MAG: hypothetical protein ABSG26_09995 [Bryobacteraceae bacterium]|jgi:hypothetical protein